MTELEQRASMLFEQVFGGGPELISICPGRVNLIGEHTDYQNGLVMPVAIDRYVVVAARRVEDRTRLVSDLFGKLDFDVAQPEQAVGWGRYAAGMAWVFRESGVHCPNFEAVVVSDLPTGAGLSSSAAMEVAFGNLYRHFAATTISDLQLATMAQKCENEFVGVPCGLMDQLICASAKPHQALMIDFENLSRSAYVPVPENWSLVLCDTGTKHALGESGYPLRRQQSEQAAKLLGKTFLREARIEEVEPLDPTLAKRARHVITENARVLAFRTALQAHDVRAVSELMRESHESLRDDYEVSCSELDAMAEACWGAPGCIGARMTGGGFGGACVALVDALKVAEFIDYTSERFSQKTARKGSFHTCSSVGKGCIK